MSRLEKTLERKNKKRKYRKAKKIVFMIFLILSGVICVGIVDTNAKSMLGMEAKTQDRLTDIRKYLDQAVQNINDISLNIKEQTNKK